MIIVTTSPPEWNQPPNQPPYYGPPQPKPRPKWLIPVIAGAAALVLVLVLVFAFTRGGDDPKPVVTAAPPVAVTTAPGVIVTTPPVDVTTPPVTTTTPTGVISGSPRPGASDDDYLAGLLITDSKGVNHGDYWQSRINAQRENVLRLGYAVCNAYDQGAAPSEIVQAMTDNGIPATEANWARASAVVLLCPEHKSN